MKNIKRYAALLCTAILLISFVGCGSKTKDLSGSTAVLSVADNSTAQQNYASDNKSDTSNVNGTSTDSGLPKKAVTDTSLAKLQYEGKPYVTVNGNKPQFEKGNITKKSFEVYSLLDKLGRCGYAVACVGRDLMPTEKRGEIGMVKPTGWHTVKYDCVDGKYLFNRCHLIGYQLSGENANNRNLITGTRYMNVDGMLPFENMVADYVKETNNHVVYRVTPVFDGSNMLASGVQMEGYSVEDNGAGISFNVYCFNVQPGVIINYTNGESSADGKNKTNASSAASAVAPVQSQTGGTYVLNTNTKKVHKPDCHSLKQAKQENLEEYSGSLQSILNSGYSTCKNCNPQ